MTNRAHLWFSCALLACASPQQSPDAEATSAAPPSSTSATGPDVDGANCAEPKPSPTHVCVQDCGPPVVREDTPPPAWRWLTPEDAKARAEYGCPKCLPADARVDTPIGSRPVSELRVNDAIWSQNDNGVRVASRVTKTSSTPILGPHSFYRLALSDGRALRASGQHPLADGRLLAAAPIDSLLDGAKIVDVRIERTTDERTYDILPATTRGTYWVSGVLVASTLRE
jgi:hypothetical protein